MNECLKKDERLLSHREFIRCLRYGRRMSTPSFALIYYRNDVGRRRVGVSVSKKVIKKAVYRNRAKRIMRELFRRNKDLFPMGHDFIFVAKRDFLRFKWGEHLSFLRRLF